MNIKHIIISIALILLFNNIALSQMIDKGVHKDYSCFRNGDIIFYEGAGNEDFSESIKDATSNSSNEIRITHAGIISKTIDGIYVIEATQPDGVIMSRIDEFISKARKVGNSYKILVKRLANTDKEIIERAVKTAETLIGKEYDDEFDESNDKYYCSELIRFSFKEKGGAYIFDAQPMNFKNKISGEFDSFWIKHFEDIGKPIPEGELGTNPHDLSLSSVLITVNHDCIYINEKSKSIPVNEL